MVLKLEGSSEPAPREFKQTYPILKTFRYDFFEYVLKPRLGFSLNINNNPGLYFVQQKLVTLKKETIKARLKKLQAI